MQVNPDDIPLISIEMVKVASSQELVAVQRKR